MKLFNSASLRKTMEYAQPYKNRFRWVIFFAIALSIFAAVRPYMLKETVNQYLQPQDQHGLLLYIGLMGVVLILEVSSQFLFTYWASWLGQDIVKDIREKLFERIIAFRMSFFDKEPIGKLVTRAVSDIESIASIFSQGLFMILSDFLKMFVVLGFMFYMNWKLSCIVLITMPILLYATRVFQLSLKASFQEVRTQIANLNTFVQERISGMLIVQLFTRERIEYEKFKEINEKHNQAWIKNILYNSIFFPIADILSSLTLGIVIWYGGVSIVDGDSITTFGDLFAYTMLITMLFNPLRQIADKFNVMQMGIIAAERVFEILETSEEIEDKGKLQAPSFKGNIDLTDVHFSYIKGIEVLKGIDLHIKAGQTVAIVGSSGAGKSTIINLLNRFYTINQGKICIDGINIDDFEITSLRKQIAVVLQDVFLFSDTILNNITLYNPAVTKEFVIESAKKIGIHDFIESLPGGYDYNVKERGATLSSGQRQLIAFLRAYVSQPSILILDEATSSIDSHSEELLQKATDYLTHNQTSIIIAHRLATIVNADIIVVMDKGKIVEQGTHTELLTNKKGYYSNLHNSQFKKSNLT